MTKPTRGTDARAARIEPVRQSVRRTGERTLPTARMSRRAFLALLAHPLAFELDRDR